MAISLKKLYSAASVLGGLVLLNLGFYYLALDLTTNAVFSKIFVDLSLAATGAALIFVGALVGLRD